MGARLKSKEARFDGMAEKARITCISDNDSHDSPTYFRATTHWQTDSSVQVRLGREASVAHSAAISARDAEIDRMRAELERVRARVADAPKK